MTTKRPPIFEPKGSTIWELQREVDELRQAFHHHRTGLMLIRHHDDNNTTTPQQIAIDYLEWPRKK